jgi:hypothetical protein
MSSLPTHSRWDRSSAKPAAVRPLGRWLACAQAAALLGLAGPVLAAGTCSDYLNALARRESSLNPQAQNAYGYVGLFQMGEAALVDAGYYRADGTGANDWRGTWTGLGGVTSLQDFKNDPAAQAAAVAAYHQRVWGYVRSQGLDTYIGSTVGGVPVTQSGLIAAAHLVGTGNLARFLASNGATVPTDGNGTALTEYLASFGGYSLFGSGADCAAWASGTPTGGVDVDTADTPATGGGTPFGVAPPAMPISADQAFYDMTGRTSGELGRLIRLTTGALLFLIAAWSWLGSWDLYSEGRTTQHHFLHDNQRLLVLVLAVLLVLS